MGNAPSSTTKPVSFRLKNDVHAVIERRANKQGKTLGEYLRDWVSYDTRRKR